jgi:tetratricopeptide (TPR) repeat protein
MAYQRLGQPDKAAPHLRQWRNRDIFVPDPLQQELDLLLESGLSYELRGVRALEARDWKTAAAFFRKGAALTRDDTPLGRSLHHKLGTALYLDGDVNGARAEFEQVVRLAPVNAIDESSAKAHYSLGVLAMSQGRIPDGVRHLQSAVTYQPSYGEAHLALAEALRTTGRAADALDHYKEAVDLNPANAQARFGYATCLVRLKRYREARDWLTDATTRAPDAREFQIALARLLAAAPDPAVRDGSRAVGIVEQLVKTDRSLEVGETLAMALAETGQFDRAVGVQRGIIGAAEQAGREATARRMTVNLQLYQRRQPSRTPWQDDDALFSGAARLASDAQSALR